MIPVFNPPKSARRKGKKKLNKYQRFVKSYVRKHKGSSVTDAAAAWTCGYKGKASKSQRRHARRSISKFRKSARKTRRKHGKHWLGGKSRKSLYEKYSYYLTGGGGKHRERHMARLKGRMDQVERAKKSREWKKAAADADRGLGYSFFGLNPGRRHMKRRLAVHMNPSSVTSSLTAGFRPKNLIGVMPMIGGAVANGMLKSLISKRISALDSGLPNIALGIATAGIVGAIGGMIKPGIGQSMFLGALVESVAEGMNTIAKKGLSGLGNVGIEYDVLQNGTMSDFADPRQMQHAFSARQPMGDFADPRQMAAAVQLGMDNSQYPMPMPGAQRGGQLPNIPTTEEVSAIDTVIQDHDLATAAM